MKNYMRDLPIDKLTSLLKEQANAIPNVGQEDLFGEIVREEDIAHAMRALSRTALLFSDEIDSRKQSEKEIAAWKDQLPDDLTYGSFSEDFMIDGVQYRHGAWNTDGDWVLAWNTDEEFQGQVAQLRCE